MMNAWLIIVPALVLFTVLLGRYTLQIRIVRTGGLSDVVARLRSLGDVAGLDWQLIGSDSSFRLVLFRRAFCVSGAKGESPGATEEDSGREPVSTKRKRRRLAVRGLHKIFKVGYKALVRIIRVFHLEQGWVNVRFGTGDPYTTGILYGLVQILLVIRRKRAEVKIVPDFLNRKLEGDADLTFRFIMLRLVVLMIAVLFKAVVELRKS
jgi:hypothetical protein